MTPKRFKAVCTETGAEETDISIVFPKESHKNLITYEGPYKIFSSKGILVEGMGWEPCQSTGLTDSRGQEVYEGDIILVYFPRTDSGYVYSVFFDRGGFKLEGFYFPGQERPGGQRHWLGIEVLLDAIEDGARLYCVGNKWQPAAELQARAEAVSNEL